MLIFDGSCGKNLRGKCYNFDKTGENQPLRGTLGLVKEMYPFFGTGFAEFRLSCISFKISA
jgi:hypothetical protein